MEAAAAVVAAVVVVVVLLLPLLVALLASGDAVIDEGAVVAADTVIGVDLGTKTGALMLSADMDEKTPDPVRGRRTLPLLASPKCVSPTLCHYASSIIPSYISALSWGGDGLFYSDNKCSFHWYHLCCYTQQLSLEITHRFMIELAPFPFEFTKAMYNDISTQPFCVRVA